MTWPRASTSTRRVFSRWPSRPIERAKEERIEFTDTPPLNDGAGLQAAAGADAWVEERHFRVILSLANGDWVELASFGDEPSAEDCARDMAARLASGGEWPRVRGRYLRPDTIVAIEISERRRLSGSDVRANYWQGLDGQEQPG